MRGSVSAGMCVALDAAGLIGAFDRIYGCSAGAVNGAFTAAGQAWHGATIYEETASRRFIDARRLVRGRRTVFESGVSDDGAPARRASAARDGQAGHEALDLPLERSRQRLVEVVDAEDEAPIGSGEGANVGR